MNANTTENKTTDATLRELQTAGIDLDAAFADFKRKPSAATLADLRKAGKGYEVAATAHSHANLAMLQQG